ncbi:hypothetical protein KKH56_04610 [bacterium]|nr:hypothetical protein [bacterium]
MGLFNFLRRKYPFWAGIESLKNGDCDKALDFFETCIPSFPKMKPEEVGNTLTALSILYGAAGDKRRAIDCIATAQEMSPDNKLLAGIRKHIEQTKQNIPFWISERFFSQPLPDLIPPDPLHYVLNQFEQKRQNVIPPYSSYVIKGKQVDPIFYTALKVLISIVLLEDLVDDSIRDIADNLFGTHLFGTQR